MPHSPPSRSGTAPCAGGGLPEGLCRGLGAGTPGVQPDQGAGQGTGSRERDPGRPRTRGKGPSDTALVPPPDHPSTSRHPAGSKPRQSGPEAASGRPISARLSRRRPITARLFNPAAVPQALPAQPRRGPSERHRPPVPLRRGKIIDLGPAMPYVLGCEQPKQQAPAPPTGAGGSWCCPWGGVTKLMEKKTKGLEAPCFPSVAVDVPDASGRTNPVAFMSNVLCCVCLQHPVQDKATFLSSWEWTGRALAIRPLERLK
ncbi:WAS/WASL-interacting protein family member 1-like [Pseudopipra pipra]|uniref:WAS/WASL-interacting protein family member 1-like n=1 Tax=Pseudopipra pipra TaxID=415032 RepID=UPI00313A42EC